MSWIFYADAKPGDVLITPDGYREVEWIDVDHTEGIAWFGFTDGLDCYCAEFRVEVI